MFVTGGLSPYGSYLGITYANLIPANVRALVIDGATDPIAWSRGVGNEATTIPFTTRLRSGHRASSGPGSRGAGAQQHRAATRMRIGQALGLRHGDVVSHERRIELVSREDNVNGARGKGGRGAIPITSELVRSYADYMHEEYGELDCDDVFVNLWAGRIGRPMRYANVVEIVRRTRRRVGFTSQRISSATPSPRWRAAAASRSRWSAGCSPTARSTRPPAPTFHGTVEDLRSELERAGWLPELGATGA